MYHVCGEIKWLLEKYVIAVMPFICLAIGVGNCHQSYLVITWLSYRFFLLVKSVNTVTSNSHLFFHDAHDPWLRFWNRGSCWYLIKRSAQINNTLKGCWIKQLTLNDNNVLFSYWSFPFKNFQDIYLNWINCWRSQISSMVTNELL